MVCTGHVRRWWVQARLVHPLSYKLATKCMLHSKFSVYVQWWWHALATCIPYVHKYGMFHVQKLCFRLWTVQLQHEYGFKTVMHGDWVFETVIKMTMVSKRSCMVARSLKRSCRMNMVSKRSYMVIRFWNGHAAWDLGFQNGHARWLGFWKGHQGVPKGSHSLYDWC